MLVKRYLQEYKFLEVGDVIYTVDITLNQKMRGGSRLNKLLVVGNLSNNRYRQRGVDKKRLLWNQDKEKKLWAEFIKE